MKSLQSTWFSHGLLFGFSLWLLITGAGFRFPCVYCSLKRNRQESYSLLIISSRYFLPLLNKSPCLTIKKTRPTLINFIGCLSLILNLLIKQQIAVNLS